MMPPAFSMSVRFHDWHDDLKFALCVLAALVVYGLFVLSFHL